MKTSTPSLTYTKQMWSLFRLHSHLLLAWGYKDIKPRLRTKDEEEITDLLFQAVNNILCSGRSKWCSHYSIKNESPISGGKRKGKSRREIDLIIEYVYSIGHPEYVFEAKPLNSIKKYGSSGFNVKPG